MSEHESLGLRAVTERFEESTGLMDQLRDRLSALTLAEETQGRAAQALDGSATQLGALVGEIRGVVEGLAAAQASTQAALDVARTTLESTDLQVLRDEISAVHAELRQLRELTSEAQAAATLARADADDARRQHAELAAKVATLPARARRRAGLA
jgi:chromosome segregation ATPase